MEIIFTKRFQKQLEKVPLETQQKTKAFIENLTKATSLQEIKDCKKMQGYSNYYRVRIADYRIGIAYQKPNVILLVIMLRKEVYNSFPPK